MKTKAFTLVEMLIVMGIIIILMAVGIASGRFAIRRANKIEHQNAAGNIYQALQSYYIENREYPPLYQEDGVTRMNPQALLESADLLDNFVDDFNGGSEASFGYIVDNTQQTVLICVTYGGIEDQNLQGLYCTGNGIGAEEITADEYTFIPPTIKDIPWEDSVEYGCAGRVFEEGCSNWQEGQWSGDCTGLYIVPSET